MKNIVLIFTDQMRFDTIGALGNNTIKTPVLDSLVQNGTTFTRAYTPCPVCVPARYSMHTGLMPHQTGVFENCVLPPEKARKSFMQVLSENGYETFGAGKMHFTFPEGLTTKWGFDTRKSCDIDNDLPNNDFYQDIKKAGYGHVYDYKGVRSEMYYIPQISQLPENLHHTHWTVDKCIDFIDGRDESKPFFMMASFEKPHPPFEPPVPWNKLYRGPDMPLPKISVDNDDLLTVWNQFQNRYKYRDQGADLNLIRQMKAHYYAEISFIDSNVGRLLKKLGKENLLDDTLIVFTSDHGEFLGDYSCYGKRSFLDSAARIPMLVCGPDVKKGVKCDVPVTLVDIFPTLMEFAEVTNVPDNSGESMLKIANEGTDREFIVGQYEEKDNACYMLIQGCYKYIYSAPDEKEYLFEQNVDPFELSNRAQNSLYVQKTIDMRKTLIAYFEEQRYNEPIENGEFKKYGVKKVPSARDAGLLFQDPIDSIPHIEGYSTDANQKNMHKFFWLSDNFKG